MEPFDATRGSLIRGARRNGSIIYTARRHCVADRTAPHFVGALFRVEAQRRRTAIGARMGDGELLIMREPRRRTVGLIRSFPA